VDRARPFCPDTPYLDDFETSATDERNRRISVETPNGFEDVYDRRPTALQRGIGMLVSDRDIRDFVDFEKASWVKLSAHYDDFAGRTTRQATDVALEAVNAAAGTRLLDVATGPGYVAAEAVRRGADAIGIDFSSDMVADARKRFPELQIRIGDAERLDFRDDTFDAVVCAFGLLHLPRPGKAIAEAYRVLRPGGRYAFTVWSNNSKVRLFDIIAQVVQKYADPSIPTPPGPSQFMLSDPWVCKALMDAATFADVRVSEIPSDFEPTSPLEVVDFMRKCTVRAAHLYDRQTPERQLEIDDALTKAAASAMAEGGGKIPCPALLVTGVKPL
jgi:SAM-dependent methyltransferase